MKIFEKIHPIYIYYAIMLIFITLRTSESEPSFTIRYGYLFAFFLPLILKFSDLLPACLTCFMTVGLYGFAYNFFPYQMLIYPIICLMAVLFSGNKLRYNTSTFTYLIIYVLFHLLLVNLLDSGSPQDVFYSTLTIVFFSIIVSHKLESSSFYLMNGFTFASLSLSYIYFANYERFLVSYNALDGMERSGWTDPNYLSCVIGMGVITSTLLLFTQKGSSLLIKICWITIASFSFAAQLIMASRGGILAVVLAMGIILFALKIKNKYKILAIIACAIFVIILYNYGFFELLEYRIENDSGGGSGRDIIWQAKLNAFVDKANILQWLFGMGSEGALNITGQYVGFHNDYLSTFCSYGLIGLLSLCYLLYYPIKVAAKYQKTVVLAMVLYLATCSLTLEPLTAGRLTYIAFYFLILIYAKSTRLSNIKK